MKYKNILFPRSWMLLAIIVFLSPIYTWSQCTPVQVLHTFGTEQVGCTEITVTSDGSVAPGPNPVPPCIYGPYSIGLVGSGSYTFTFSPPVAEVSINVRTLDNSGGSTEEMALEVNGVFFPVSNSGTPDGCLMPVIIWPPGTIRGPVGGSGSSKDIIVTANITSLKIENNWVSGTPAGFLASLSICCPTCETDAGEITSSPLNLCPDEPAMTPPAEQTFLESGDLLQYILFSNPADTLGSIIATSNTSEFTFDPITMQTGVAYYIAAIAGNDLGGNVDLDDPCLDISNAIVVTWHPMPTVSFFTANADLCAGECRDIEINFTGTPPFQLSGEITDGNNIISIFDDTYTGNMGILTVCLPANTPVGTISIQATNLIDANCTCN